MKPIFYLCCAVIVIMAVCVVIALEAGASYIEVLPCLFIGVPTFIVAWIIRPWNEEA